MTAKIRKNEAQSASEVTSRSPARFSSGGGQTSLSSAPFEVSTALTLEECERRLREAVDTRRFTLWSESHYTQTEVVGSVSSRSFKIRRRRHQLNSFAPILVGNMESTPGGTVVKAKFRMLLPTLEAIAQPSVRRS
jgi:hypothetical protein